MGTNDPCEAHLGTTYENTSPPPADALSVCLQGTLPKSLTENSTDFLTISATDQNNGIIRRLERYCLQSVVRKILSHERVARCHRQLRPSRTHVEIYMGKERAYYGGLMTCGSLWNCPVCAASISQDRRQDLKAGMEYWKKNGGQVLMATETVPHYNHQPLIQVLQCITNARRLMRKRKPWIRLAKQIGLVGTVRMLEVTWGVNGWHVHCHELLFLRDKVENLKELEELVYPMWRDACITAGLVAPDRKHGLKIEDGSQAAEYASKWGLEDEMTKGHIKVAKPGNFSPWDLLRKVRDDVAVDHFGNLFREYAKAFKSKRQLVWSDGLRDLLGLGAEKTEEEAAAAIEDGAELLGLLSVHDWRLVLRADRRAELLEVASKSGWDGVVKFIRDVCRKDCPF